MKTKSSVDEDDADGPDEDEKYSNVENDVDSIDEDGKDNDSKVDDEGTMRVPTRKEKTVIVTAVKMMIMVTKGSTSTSLSK